MLIMHGVKLTPGEDSINNSVYYFMMQGCVKVGRAMNLPPTAVLSGYIILGIHQPWLKSLVQMGLNQSSYYG